MDTIVIEFDIADETFAASFFDNTVRAMLTNGSSSTLPLGLQGLHVGEMMRGEYEAPWVADYDANGAVEDAD